MKKHLCSWTALVAAFSLLSTCSFIPIHDVQADEDSYRKTYTIFGDLNSDKSIDSFDSVLMRKAIAQNEYSKIADLNFDQKVDADDLELLNGYVLGNNDVFMAYLSEDADEDGICDIAEIVLLKIDPDSKDTDNDGLSDYYEVTSTDTDPAVLDSFEKGVADSKSDSDSDGLSNEEEEKYGTDPTDKDTDNDGLEDGYEIKTSKTDSLKKDTDGDGLTDFEEEKLGVDPLNTSTDGTADNKRIFKQVIEADDPLLRNINTEDNAYELSIEISAAGYAPHCLKARESGYSYALKDSSAIGETPEFVYRKGFEVESITLNYKIKDAFVDNVSHYFDDVQDDYYEYSYQIDPEFDGIKRLNVFKYFKTVNMVMPIKTDYDVENNVVSATIDTFEKDDEGNPLGIGSYSLVDLEVWASMMNVVDDTTIDNVESENNVDAKSLSYPNINALANESKTEYRQLKKRSDAEHELIRKNYQSSVSTNKTGENQKIGSFFGHKYAFYDSQSISWSEAQAKCRAKGGHLMTINSPFEFNYLNNTLSQGRKGGFYWLGATGGSGKWKWITGESTSYARTISVSGYTMDRCENYFSALGNCLAYCPALAYLSEGFPSYSHIKGYICEWEPGASVNDAESQMVSVNTGSGSSAILEAELSPDNNADSDGDGISDWDEVDHSAIGRITGDGNASSVPWESAYNYLNAQNLLGNAVNEIISRISRLVPNLPNITPTGTDLTSDDSDKDGIPEKKDPRPNSRGTSDDAIGELTIISTEGDGLIDQGHSWLQYKSYFGNLIDVRDFITGYVHTPDEGWHEIDADYNIMDPGEFISFGNWSLGAGIINGNIMAVITPVFIHTLNGGICYNSEFFHYWESAYAAFTREINESQFNDLLDYLDENNYYNLYTHNCSTVALGGWEAAFGSSDGLEAASYIMIDGGISKLIDNPKKLSESISNLNGAIPDYWNTWATIHDNGGFLE